MVNFVICEDDKTIRNIILDIITSIMMPKDIEYKIHEYGCYDSCLAKLINNRRQGNIYILDIELPNKSGLDIARKIRQKDWESVIIFSTAHYELYLEAIKNRLMILDFISKFNDYEKRLRETIELALSIVDKKKSLIFESGNILHKIRLDDIIYITRETFERKTVIKTAYGIYRVNENISKMLEGLDARFFQSHRSCIVNTDYIKTVDFKEEKIVFNNGEYTYLLARSKKKGLRSYVTSNK
ncbi:MAG: LytTR family DNA-binding domain-containing protein [Bacilli bacterium]|nr:LytTR family DNA-binding domain-containing protein [Bacilli bacterium]